MEPGKTPNNKRKRDDADDAAALLNSSPFDNNMIAHQETASTQLPTPTELTMHASMRMDNGNTFMGTTPENMFPTYSADHMTQAPRPPRYREDRHQNKKPHIQTPAEQEEEGRMLRLKNKEAAKRCREKKKQEQQQFENELRRLRQENFHLMGESRNLRAKMDQLQSLINVHEQCDHPEMRSYFEAKNATAIQQSREAYAQICQNPTVGYPQDAYNGPALIDPQGFQLNGFGASQPVQQPIMKDGGNSVIPTPSPEAMTPDSGVEMSRISSTQTTCGSAAQSVAFERTAGPSTEGQAHSYPAMAPDVVDGANLDHSQDADGYFVFY